MTNYEIVLSWDQSPNWSLENKLFEAPGDPELHHIENISSSYSFSQSNVLKQRKYSIFLIEMMITLS